MTEDDPRSGGADGEDGPPTASRGWFEGVADTEAGAARIRAGRADEPTDWPRRAVESGFADDETDYYAKLHEAAVKAAREGAAERERADDQQLVHAVRAMDDMGRILL